METAFIRDGKKLIDVSKEQDDPKRVEDLKTVNQAKRKSRELQLTQGGLGAGYVKRA